MLTRPYKIMAGEEISYKITAANALKSAPVINELATANRKFAYTISHQKRKSNINCKICLCFLGKLF